MMELDLLNQSNGVSVIPEKTLNGSCHKADWSQINEHANVWMKEKKENEIELTSTEVKIVDKKPKEKNKEARPVVGLFQLFRYADKMDVVFLTFGMIFTVGTGIAFPVGLIVYGDVATGYIFNDIYKSWFANNSANTSNIPQFPYGDKYKDIFDFVLSYNYTLYYCMIGVGTLVCAYLEFVFWNISAERQMNRIRKLFYQSIMRQEIGWFDTHKAGELGNLFTQDMQNLASGIGDKTALCFQWIAAWLSCYIIALVKGWNLTLATMSVFPLMGMVAALSMRWMKNMTLEELKAYSSAGAVAEEVFSAIRTVTAFIGQEKECQKFEHRLSKAHSLATRKGLVFGLSTGAFSFFIFSALAIAFWYGTELIINKEAGFEPGNIITILYAVIIGTTFLAQAFSAVDTISAARAAATRVFEIIERDSDIDVTAEKGYTPETVSGNIELKDIHFHYPSRRDVQVLKGLSLRVDVGKTVALVGSSGSGKSTVVQLMQRFYNPQQGQVLLDGRAIKDLNLKWLREQIGVVSQEPVLFATTIRENIRYGRMDVTDDEIEGAAKKANAHEFISMFPKGYDTLVGDRGAQMSGGQKQRIAIARALIRNPKILLLDEATSALDNESEAIVQNAIEKAQIGRTTIVIAHRLSTILNADSIYVLVNGQVVEQGTHTELMQKEGAYHGLIKHQEVQHVSEEVKVSEELEHAITDSPARNVGFSNPVKEQPLSQKSHKTVSEDKMEKETLPEFSMKRILHLSAPEWYLLVMGCITAVIAGAMPPSFSFLFSEFLGVLSGESDLQMRESTKILVAITMGIAAFNAVLRVLLLTFFTNAGANLTRRLRAMTFRAILRQDIAFFDDPNNSVAHLSTRLSNDCTMVQGATGFKMCILIESASTITTALAIAFFYSWKLTLVILSFMPVMIAVGTIQGRLINRLSKSDKRLVEEAGQIFFQSIDNMRTVVSLTIEEMFLLKYSKIIDFVQSEGIKRSFAAGILFAMSNGIVFFAYATAVTYAAYLIQNDDLAFKYAVRVFSVIIFGGWSIGNNSSNAQDFSKAKLATTRLFAIMDRVSPIDSASNDDKTCESFSGAIEFKNVSFHYQTRPDANVLNDISFVVQPGVTLALAGSSGCGKSTTVSLIERFYDPVNGQVLADGNDLKSLNLNWLRSQISVVSQEPTLFNSSIRENIAYGDNSRIVTIEEIIQAARSANIHNFISSLPLGYETNVGAKGTQLSGGQKQRIAIARALIRNPKILLLDEATSALDSESETVVQEALNKARVGRTCIVIAHRLSTIQNADKIAIIHKGAVVELGNHAELMARKGAYYRLQNAQQRR
ncbi:hypothetical protein CHS0354_002696 [Potamilus streckersoni]|uniref:ABC-type xenobiotic transporter n=1 Tax=Potamilus streckersoni TaxID=2493646 RepID=A0AAE0RVU7_9BIVA|nr:hypothetical protein CHS0354_002696 [Potamilus streckersoni]